MLQLMIIKLRAIAKCSSVGVYLNAIFNKSLMTNMYYIYMYTMILSIS